MTSFQRLLLIPCLSPVVLMLLIASLNLGQASSLRVLTWRLPTLPIGAWIAVATVLGSGVSATTGLAMVTSRPVLRREVRRPATGPDVQEPLPHEQQQQARPAQPTPWPERDVRDPAPTVSVPFRVVHRGSKAQENATTTQSKDTNPIRQKEQQANPSTAGAGGEAWTDADDWNQQIGDDW
jgi:hypothetical protein